MSPAAAAQTGVIAYVEDTNRDEIRLINPDGSNDRRLWGHNVADFGDGELQVGAMIVGFSRDAVSYTHLDVYKRQQLILCLIAEKVLGLPKSY